MASFITSHFPGSRLMTQRKGVEPLQLLPELNLGKERERQSSRAIDVTPSTSPIRLKETFWLRYSTNAFWDLLFNNCLTIFPAPPNLCALLCGNGEGKQHTSPWFTQPSLLLTK